MSNYYASEIGLTKATKALLDNKPMQFCRLAPEFAPLPKQDNKIVVIKMDKFKKVTREALDDFQQNRLFQIIRNEGNA